MDKWKAAFLMMPQAWWLCRELLVFLHYSHACCTLMRHQTDCVVPRLSLCSCSCVLLVVLMSRCILEALHVLVTLFFSSDSRAIVHLYCLFTCCVDQSKKTSKKNYHWTIVWYENWTLFLYLQNTLNNHRSFFSGILAVVVCIIRRILYVWLVKVWCFYRVYIVVWVYSIVIHCLLV